MKRLCGIALCFFIASVAVAQAGSRKTTREDWRRAPDRMTEGWIVSYENPDPQRSWERIAGALVIARHGKVIRRLTVASDIRSWAFWKMGREVAVEAGGLHGPSACFLVSVKSGKHVAEVEGDCDVEDVTAPAWVKAMVRSGADQPAPQVR